MSCPSANAWRLTLALQIAVLGLLAMTAQAGAAPAARRALLDDGAVHYSAVQTGACNGPGCRVVTGGGPAGSSAEQPASASPGNSSAPSPSQPANSPPGPPMTGGDGGGGGPSVVGGSSAYAGAGAQYVGAAAGPAGGGAGTASYVPEQVGACNGPGCTVRSAPGGGNTVHYGDVGVNYGRR